jgi:hypothetical protein
MNWEDKTTVKKGNIGEEIVKNNLEKKGYIVYKCITEKAHAFDFLAIKDKKVFLIAEVKTKGRMNKFEATGIDLRHFLEYKYILDNQKIDVILFFVDEHPKEERVYCQKLSKLIEEKTIENIKYPNFDILKKMNIVLFSLSDMVTICKLSNDQLNELKKYNSRNYQYF